MMLSRRVPLIVVASALPGAADQVAEHLRQEGAVAYATHSAEGCLRVATSIAPDIILIDPALPERLERLLRAHPKSAHAQLVHLTDAMAAPVEVERTAHLAAA
jgi:DNA-binding response OmpR family regulator